MMCATTPFYPGVFLSDRLPLKIFICGVNKIGGLQVWYRTLPALIAPLEGVRSFCQVDNPVIVSNVEKIHTYATSGQSAACYRHYA
jgi:hypothetical protein